MLQPLQRPVRGPGGGHKALAQLVHPLVVGAVHQGAFSKQTLQQAPRGGADGVEHVLLPLVQGGALRPQVLKQGPAQGHADHLHPPADPQDGPAPGEPGPDQRQLRLIPSGVRRVGAPVLLAEPGRVQVPSPAQHQPQAAGVGLRGVAGDRSPAGPLHRPDVVIHPPLRPGDLDGGRHGRASHWFSWSRFSHRRTSVAMSSTAPSTPVTLELRVRSYWRISPQLCPV